MDFPGSRDSHHVHESIAEQATTSFPVKAISPRATQMLVEDAVVKNLGSRTWENYVYDWKGFYQVPLWHYIDPDNPLSTSFRSASTNACATDLAKVIQELGFGESPVIVFLTPIITRERSTARASIISLHLSTTLK